MAAIAAGLAHVTAPVVVVLTPALPFVTAEDVHELVAAAPSTAHRAQYLLGAFPTAALRAALPVDSTGAQGGRLIGLLAP